WLQLVNTSLRVVAAYTSIYVVLSCGLRLCTRWLHDWSRRTGATAPGAMRRVVVVGAGESGAALIKTMQWSPKLLMEPVAVLDDDRNKHGNRLHGAPIVGSVAELSVIVQKYQADEIVIAIPSASRDQIGRVVDACAATRLPFRIAPDPEDVLQGRSGPSTLRGVQPSDLLGRAQVDLRVEELRAEFQGARILITGAAGSIGSELVRQLAQLDPAVLYLVDRNENDLYVLRNDLDRAGVAVSRVDVIQDVRDGRRMGRIMQKARPTHVFHAAAFKHVPLMESHVTEAVENNILATLTTLEVARAAGVKKFVLISSDKAVRPSSVMGATKRFAEILVAEGTRDQEMKGVIVRFGNVLGSNGSVVPLFQRQIAAGGPVTITDPDASRYFMTTPEAASLVLQSVAMPESAGQVALLDMGTPVRIWDLAERLIRMSGFRPGADIEMVVVGLRPGEKLHEELWWDANNARPSSHPKIMLADVGGPAGGLRGLIPVIRDLVEKDDPILLHNLLEESVGLSNGHSMHPVRMRHRPSGPTHSPSERAVGTP
ncbi:MAG TPA: nucleoside-diphosphate sugar epimerase/dehydratase, partial [Candidatus Binatia bacterium]|nr:nucleoside-diphosphate sugar epimerase/dehydratase [Candidatus Binatia bacterium]